MKDTEIKLCWSDVEVKLLIRCMLTRCPGLLFASPSPARGLPPAISGDGSLSCRKARIQPARKGETEGKAGSSLESQPLEVVQATSNHLAKVSA